MNNTIYYKFKKKLDNDFRANKEAKKGAKLKKMKSVEERRIIDEARLRVAKERERQMNKMARMEYCDKMLEHTGLMTNKTYKAYFTDWWDHGNKNLHDIVIVDYIGLIKNETSKEEYVRIKSNRFFGEVNINIKDIIKPRILSEEELEMIKEIDPYGEDEWGY